MSDTYEALRRLGAQLVACDKCARLVAVGQHWLLCAYVDGELVDWGPITCSEEHANAMKPAPWHAATVRRGKDVGYSVHGPDFWNPLAAHDARQKK